MSRRTRDPILSKLLSRVGKEPELPETPPDYVDATIVMTRLATPPFIDQKVMPGEAQFFRIGVQAYGRHIAERLIVEIRVGGAAVNRFPAYHLIANGYHTTQIDPYYVRMGEVVSVETLLVQSDRWWKRWRDRLLDWWSPPKARVIVSGVVRLPTVEA